MICIFYLDLITAKQVLITTELPEQTRININWNKCFLFQDGDAETFNSLTQREVKIFVNSPNGPSQTITQ